MTRASLLLPVDVVSDVTLIGNLLILDYQLALFALHKRIAPIFITRRVVIGRMLVKVAVIIV